MTLKHQDFINPQHDVREARRRLAIEIRAHGMAGVAPLPRYAVTCRGKATHTVNLDAIGMQPSAQPKVCDSRDSGMFDVSNLARYRDHYKGEQFADSANRALVKRHNDWFKGAFPYWPVDASGRIKDGKIGKTGRRYFDMDGTRWYIGDLYTAWASAEGADTVAERTHKEELQRLIADQEADAIETRKHSRKTGMIGR